MHSRLHFGDARISCELSLVTMDAVLASASFTFAYFLPEKGAFDLQRLPVKSILFLSCLLFSLSIIDATPSTWLLVLTHSSAGDELSHGQKDRNSYRSIEYAYYVNLWSIALIILVVQPSTIGTRLCGQLLSFISHSRISDTDQEGEKKITKTFYVKKDYSIAVRALLLALRLLLWCIFQTLWFVFGWIWMLLMKVLPKRQNGPILALHQGRDGLPAWTVQAGGRLKAMILGSILGTGCTFFLLRWVASPVLAHDSPNQTLLAKTVSLMVASGIVISSVLNGFGSVSMPYTCLSGLFLTPIGTEAVAYAEKECENATICLNDLRVRIDSVRLEVHKMGDSPMRRKGFADIGDEVNNRRKMLANEAAFMEQLVEEMKEDLKELRHSQYIAVTSRSPIGVLRSWLGVVFSLILVMRLISATMQILPQFGRDVNDRPRVDIITKMLLLTQLSSHDADLVSQFVSLLLTAFLSVSQVRYFLRTASTVNSWLRGLFQRLCCHNDEKHIISYHFHDVVSPVFAGCMGCYFLAAIVLTKLMLPVQYRAGFSAALGESQDAIRIRMDTLNTIFVLSAMVSVIILGMRLGIQKRNNERHQVWMTHVTADLDP
jgi:hypothetical protein